MTRSFLSALALVAGVLSGTPAVAGPTAAPVARVFYGDLDLASESGGRILGSRIDKALRRVCDFDRLERQRAFKAAARRCMADSRARIVLPTPAPEHLAERLAEHAAARLAAR